MYLVIVYKTPDNQFLPKIEKLQAIEFQLLSEKWSALDCYPEKGAHFEVHFGDEFHSRIMNRNNEIECHTAFVGITHCLETALKVFSATCSQPLSVDIVLSEKINILFESRSYNLGF
jgi:hypothetical protein